jgi:predicted lipoprotein
MINFKILTSLCVGSVLLFSGCGGNGSEPSPADNSKDRKQILTHWVDEIIIPSYNNFQQKFHGLHEKAQIFTNSPDVNSLAVLRSTWAEAYTEWQKTELFEFGPADKYTLRNFFNIYPADVNGILMNINDPDINLGLPASYARQGFPAIDYLINGAGTDDAAIVNFYTADGEGEKRKAYLNRIINRMNTLLTNVITEWNGAYAESFVNNTGLDIGSSTGLVVNAYILHYERFIRSGKFGIPSGAGVGGSGTPHPENIEAYYHPEISKALATTAQQAAANFFNGKKLTSDSEGPSFKSYLDALGAKDAVTGKLLSDIINEQFAAIDEELQQLTPNLHDQVVTENQRMVDVYTEMQKLVRMLKVDMTSALSVTITYTDNDGD